ncbi:MAG TPA: lipid IV(A) 3-deoxy-D-manno-octulosonic acid transferase [Steroidobacteraceae bacterium]|nr:lipid IV(A) 3-deoxy-D-manno-octulosonic acid transferase [Steroidobacteraceae bacterium]
MRRLYTLLVALALPFATLLVLWRGLRDRNYWRGWGERFGRGSTPAGAARRLWIHAVSVGEVQAAAALVEALRATWPELPLTLTSATPAGRERARQLYGSQLDVRYGPYDLPWCLKGTLRRVRPALLLIMETEIWPNLLAECAAAAVPVMFVSARLSARSAVRLRAFGSFLRRSLGSGVSVVAQSSADAGRFESLGVPAACIEVGGNLKFDRAPAATAPASGAALRSQYAAARPMWVAGSTHAGEEQAALAAHRALRAAHPAALLVLAPRHRPRFEEVAGLLEGGGLPWMRHSQRCNLGPAACAAIAVLLLDSLGDLENCYAAADIAFVGGSLVPVGGHNLLEPAALGVATLSGPHLENAPEVARLLAAGGGLRIVHDAVELGAALRELLGDRAMRARLAAAGQAAVIANRGALHQLLVRIKAQLAGARAPAHP